MGTNLRGFGGDGRGFGLGFPLTFWQ